MNCDNCGCPKSDHKNDRACTKDCPSQCSRYQVKRQGMRNPLRLHNEYLYSRGITVAGIGGSLSHWRCRACHASFIGDVDLRDHTEWHVALNDPTFVQVVNNGYIKLDQDRMKGF